MKRSGIELLLAFTFLLCLAISPASAQEPPKPLTNAAVVKLVHAGFKEKTVIAIIHSRSNQFDLSPERLVELKKAGVSENVILAMLSVDESPLMGGDDWGDDSFFRSGNGGGQSSRNGQANGGNDGAKNGSIDIFGSGGSSRGASRSRGGSNSIEGDTMTTGSATVRILKPPAEEGGGGAARLEKTPTLNNDSIVQLVEAGFSEGTIV